MDLGSESVEENEVNHDGNGNGGSYDDDEIIGFGYYIILLTHVSLKFISAIATDLIFVIALDISMHGNRTDQG